MNSDFFDLSALENSTGYQKLQALWAFKGQLIMEGAMKAAAKGNESSWRYYAGQMKGFDLAITQLRKSLMAMEKEGEDEKDSPATETVEELMRIAREPKQ